MAMKKKEERPELVGKQYAVKCIDIGKFEKFSKNRKTILDLESEEKMLRSLSHPNIVQFYELLRSDEKLYLVTEFLGGGDLLQRILDLGIIFLTFVFL